MINRTNQYVPNIGLGTYNMSPEEAEKMTYESIMYGYRHIDTAAVYRNEEAVGIGENPTRIRIVFQIPTKFTPQSQDRWF